MVTKVSRRRSTGYAPAVAVDNHLMDSREPAIFRRPTTAHGSASAAICRTHPLACVRAVANPNKRGMLFAGTGRSFYYSKDDGAHWTELASGLPHAPVSWVVVQKQFHDVVISTYGRGLYVLDDVTPLEQDEVGTQNAHLFAPRAAYRWSQRGRALINYSLKPPRKGRFNCRFSTQTKWSGKSAQRAGV